MLFHSPSSYYSMIARLALHEGGVPFESVKVDIHRRMAQFEPEYVRRNPNMTVPTLVLPDRTLTQSRDIVGLAFKYDEAPGETHDWLDRHYAFPIDELTFGWLLSWNYLARRGVPRSLAAAHKRLLSLANQHHDLEDAYRRRAEVFAGRVRTFDASAVVALFAERKKEALALLDALENTLADGRETLVRGGYGPADVVWTTFLARMHFIRFHDEIKKRPAVARYDAAMQARPSFEKADVWTRLDPIKFIKQVM
jgi:tetrachloro-p-hydroquinone reductive dehalogenase